MKHLKLLCIKRDVRQLKASLFGFGTSYFHKVTYLGLWTVVFILCLKIQQIMANAMIHTAHL